MLTSTFAKTVNNAVSNNFNPLSRVSGLSITYTGSQREIVKITVPKNDSIAFPYVFSSTQDYFLAMSSSGPLTLADADDLPLCTLDSNNNYTIIFASKATTLGNGYHSSDPRYDYNDAINKAVNNSSTNDYVITMELLRNF